MKKIVFHGAAACLALAIGSGAYLAWRADTPNAAMPRFDYTLLDGSKADSAALRGKVVLVNFWATSCAVCVQEMPQIVATHQRFNARGFETLAVAMHYDPPAAVADYAQSRRLPFAVVIDNTGAIERSFGGVRGTPTSLLIDRRGKIVKRYEGAPDFEGMRTLVERLLAQS